MQLPVPERSVADTDSFPVAPDGVAVWLATLDPLNSDRDAAELLRGLMHSNRLHNDVDRRRAVIACFVPAVRALHERLAETAGAQPLPLTAGFKRAADLASSLLREESIAFRLLLVESPQPHEEDARRAMQALLRRAELLVNGYRDLPAGLLRNAHALHRYACRHGLASTGVLPEEPDPARVLASTDELYRLLLTLCVIDPQRHRARQLPLLLDWLREHARCTRLSADSTTATMRAQARFAIDQRDGDRPADCGSVLSAEPDALLVLDCRPLIAAIDAQLDGMQQARASLLGADTLERQTLARLRLTLGARRERRLGRLREDRPVALTFAHKDICAALRYGDEHVAAAPSGWRVVDASSAGWQLTCNSAPAGSVQVGELVAVPRGEHGAQLPDDGKPRRGETRRDISLAIVRRVVAREGAALSVGLEFLAHAVMPVTLYREDDPDGAPEQGLIIACRLGERSVQSILVPPFLFQAGDRLRAAQGPRSRRVELSRCLQLNGLFSQYTLGSTPSPDPA